MNVQTIDDFAKAQFRWCFLCVFFHKSWNVAWENVQLIRCGYCFLPNSKENAQGIDSFRGNYKEQTPRIAKKTIAKIEEKMGEKRKRMRNKWKKGNNAAQCTAQNRECIQFTLWGRLSLAISSLSIQIKLVLEPFGFCAAIWAAALLVRTATRPALQWWLNALNSIYVRERAWELVQMNTCTHIVTCSEWECNGRCEDEHQIDNHHPQKSQTKRQWRAITRQMHTSILARRCSALWNKQQKPATTKNASQVLAVLQLC